MNPNRKYSYLFWGVILLLFLVGGANYLGLLKRNPLNNIVILKVNNKTLSAQEFSETLAWELKQYDVLLAKDQKIISFIKDKIINDFIQKIILIDWAKQNNIEVTDKELDDRVFEIRKNYPDDISFKQALGDSNQTVESFKDSLRVGLLQKKVFDYLAQKISDPTEAELKDFYEKNKTIFVQKPLVRLRQIVFEKEDAAQQLYNSLTPSSSFSELAKNFSVAPEAKNGGDTGWVELGTLDVFDKAFQMRVGQRSAILKSPYGYHIYEVIDKKPESYLSFSQARDKILRTIRASKEQSVYTDWLEAQAKKAQVFKNIEALEALEVTPLGE